MDKGLIYYYDIISNISKLIILDVSYSSDYIYNLLSIKISSKTVVKDFRNKRLCSSSL